MIYERAQMAGQRSDSPEYLARKAQFADLLTVYGRKTVLDALENSGVCVVKLHMAETASGAVIDRMLQLAAKRGITVNRTSHERVTRISKNGRQDQGVAADIRTGGYESAEEYFLRSPAQCVFAALDGVTTPENVGMVIRSVAAAGLDGVILPSKGCCGVNPLVIKASAGTVFRTRILRTETLEGALEAARGAGATVCALEASGAVELPAFRPPERVIYVLGGESAGISEPVRRFIRQSIRIPMHNGVESLNVAVAASLVAFHHAFHAKGNASAVKPASLA